MIQLLFLCMRWLQTIPLALIIFAPFQEEELSCGRRRGYLCATVFVGVGSVGLAVVSAAASVDGQRNIAARDISLAVMLVLFFFGWSRVVRTSAVRKFLVGGILLHYEAALQAISNVFASLILGDRYPIEINAEEGSPTFLLCLLAATVITWPLVWMFLRYTLRKNLPFLEEHDAARGLVYLCVVFLLFVVAIYNPRYELWPEVPLFTAALMVTDVITYYIFFQEIGTVRRQSELARQLERYQMEYRQLSQRMEETRRLRHDMRHHLNALGALNAQGRQEEIAAYLKEYGRVYEQLEGRKLSGDPVVDSVLEYYLAQAGEEGIATRCQAAMPGGSGVEAMDMTVLLGNCLENAMEALRRQREGGRQLSIELIPTEAMLLIRVKNTCSATEGWDSGRFERWENFPSRKEHNRKGIGLQSVSAIAEKYGGSAEFQQKGGEFTVRVVLNLFGSKREED